MIRIGIVGSDNSHAIALSQLCNLSDTPERKAIRGAKVVALFGLVPERNEEVARAGKIPTIVKKPTDMIGMVDAAFVVFRHGGLHYRYVKPFLQARIPAFVDKPLACSALRWARNTIGAPLAIGQTRFANGMGVFAQSLQEFALNGQFRRFTATVGVDAVTEGRGSVVFEVHADGKKVWASPVMSGLDEPRKLDIGVSGVNRLRLVVTDAGDGNKSDAADWCEPVLHR